MNLVFFLGIVLIILISVWFLNRSINDEFDEIHKRLDDQARAINRDWDIFLESVKILQDTEKEMAERFKAYKESCDEAKVEYVLTRMELQAMRDRNEQR